MGAFEDLTGRVFTRLTVVARAENNQQGRAQWLCLCECGAQTVVAGRHLKSGNTRSCGCLSREATSQRSRVDLTGQVFGQLTVLSHAGFDKRRNSRWLCLCECGTEKVVRGHDLKSGATKSCGCLQVPEVPTYGTAHQRIYRAKGPAAGHPCTDCGEPAADEWSYTGGDPNEFTGTHGKNPIPMAYSGSPEFYAARCRSCHAKFDQEQRLETSQIA